MNYSPRVFLAHASEDKDKVKALHGKLKNSGLTPWIDELDLEPGSVWPIEIPKAIRDCDVFIACLSNISIQKKGYVQRELRLALVEYSERPTGQLYLIPVKLDDCEIPSIKLPELSIDFADFQAADLWKNNGYERLIDSIAKTSFQNRGDQNDSIQEIELSLNNWKKLEKAVRDISASAGFTAMGYYRNALTESGVLSESENPSTLADESATVAALQTLSSFDPVAVDLDYQYRVFAEELDNEDIALRIREKLQGSPIYSHIKTSAKDFRKDWERSLSILIDPIDGTANFDANLPFFCSAVALFVGGRLSVGAIFDPFHNQVYYGSLRVLPGGIPDPVAKVWSIHTGNVDDLKEKEHLHDRRKLIATHITRTDKDARNRFLSFLPQLYENCNFGGGTYMLNSGQMALAHVASGNISTFLNNTTGIWDVAAGEVLIRATGGVVTDFMGRNIDYGESSRVSVLACESPAIHKGLLDEIEKHYPWDA